MQNLFSSAITQEKIFGAIAKAQNLLYIYQVKTFFLSILFLNCFIFAFAQDTIETTRRQLISCKVVTVGPDTIYFIKSDSTLSSNDFLLRNQVRQIKLKNGTRIPITYLENDEFIIDSATSAFKQNVIKFEMTSLLYHSFRFCYERVLSPGLNIEAQFGKIGFKDGEHPDGIILKLNVRHFFNHNLYSKKQVQPLNGKYLQLGVYYLDYKRLENLNIYYQPNRIHFISPGMSFALGQQKIRERLCIDYFFGINVELFDQRKLDQDYRWTETPLLNFVTPFDATIISLFAGISLGYTF